MSDEKRIRFTWSCSKEDLTALKIISALKQKNSSEILHLALTQYIDNNFDEKTTKKIKEGNI